MAKKQSARKPGTPKPVPTWEGLAERATDDSGIVLSAKMVPVAKTTLKPQPRSTR